MMAPQTKGAASAAPVQPGQDRTRLETLTRLMAEAIAESAAADKVSDRLDSAVFEYEEVILAETARSVADCRVQAMLLATQLEVLMSWSGIEPFEKDIERLAAAARSVYAMLDRVSPNPLPANVLEYFGIDGAAKHA